MKKIAFFVEGRTEQLFVEHVIREIAGNLPVSIESPVAKNHRKGSIGFSDIRFRGSSSQLFVLIVDCRGDGGVRSRLKESIANLEAAGYEAVIALHDVPTKISDSEIEKFRSTFSTVVDRGRIRSLLILAIREIEAWFIFENSHFAHIDSCITLDRIREVCGIDLRDVHHSQIQKPSQLLAKIYGIAERQYHKGEGARQTISVLDVVAMEAVASDVDADMRAFFDTIESFLMET